MNEIEPAKRFSLDAIRKFDAGPGGTDTSSKLSKVARQVATQYRRDTMSPVMVSGVMRLVELALLFFSGVLLFAFHVGLTTHLSWQYPTIIALASLAAVILLELNTLQLTPWFPF